MRWKEFMWRTMLFLEAVKNSKLFHFENWANHRTVTLGYTYFLLSSLHVTFYLLCIDKKMLFFTPTNIWYLTCGGRWTYLQIILKQIPIFMSLTLMHCAYQFFSIAFLIMKKKTFPQTIICLLKYLQHQEFLSN